MDELGLRRRRERDLGDRRRRSAPGDPPSIASSLPDRRTTSRDGERWPTLELATQDPAIVALKVLLPDDALTPDLIRTLTAAAVRGVEVTVVGGPGVGETVGTHALRECGVTVVVATEPVGAELVYVIADTLGHVDIGSRLPAAGMLGRTLVLDAFNRWTVRGRSA
jgi:hypothetical protein